MNSNPKTRAELVFRDITGFLIAGCLLLLLYSTFESHLIQIAKGFSSSSSGSGQIERVFVNPWPPAAWDIQSTQELYGKLPEPQLPATEENRNHPLQRRVTDPLVRIENPHWDDSATPPRLTIDLFPEVWTVPPEKLSIVAVSSEESPAAFSLSPTQLADMRLGQTLSISITPATRDPNLRLYAVCIDSRYQTRYSALTSENSRAMSFKVSPTLFLGESDSDTHPRAWLPEEVRLLCSAGGEAELHFPITESTEALLPAGWRALNDSRLPCTLNVPQDAAEQEFTKLEWHGLPAEVLTYCSATSSAGGHRPVVRIQWARADQPISLDQRQRFLRKEPARLLLEQGLTPRVGITGGDAKPAPDRDQLQITAQLADGRSVVTRYYLMETGILMVECLAGNQATAMEPLSEIHRSIHFRDERNVTSTTLKPL